MNRTWRLGLTALGLGWLVCVFIAVPALIRSGYGESSFSFVNGVFSGRVSHPVGFYLGAWRDFALQVSAGASLLVVATLGVRRFAEPLRRAGVMVVSGEPSIGARAAFWLTSVAGLLSGLIEVTFRTVHQVVVHQPASLFQLEVLWMTPLMGMATGVFFGTAIAALASICGTRVGVGKIASAWAFGVALGFMQLREVPLYRVAEVALALGVATSVARGSPRWRWITGRVERPMARLLLVSLGVIAAIAVVEWKPVSESLKARSRPESQGGPNVLLIVLDNVRADNVSLLAYERETTPELGSWAAEGMIFEQAFATGSWSMPVHTSLMTGLYDYQMSTSESAPLPSEATTIAEVLRERGYATGGFVANPWYTTEMSGLAQGFDRYEALAVTRNRILGSHSGSRLLARPFKFLTGPLGGWDLKTAPEVTDSFLRWQGGIEGRPFFAFLNYIDAHTPYDAPPLFRTAFGPEPKESWDQLLSRWPPSRAEEEGIDTWVNRYDGAISFIDHNLGRLRAELDRRGVLENTIVVITSDHGEMFGEQGQLYHGTSLYAPLIHVPLVLVHPGGVPARGQSTVAVTLRDVPATILDLAGVESSLPGNSLAELWETPGTTGTGSPLLSELAYPLIEPKPWASVSSGSMRSLVRDGLHLIVNGDGREELYDLGSDPDELVDLASAPDYQSARSSLRMALDSLAGT